MAIDPARLLETERRTAIRALPWTFLTFFIVILGLTLTYLVMRVLMTIGGSCASGGPYASARQCPDVTWLMPVGIVFGAFAAVAYVLVKPARAPSFFSLLWPALFLSLGWNFLDFGLHPPGRKAGVDWGWLVCAIVFAIMGGLPLFAMLASKPLAYLRRVFWGVDETTPPPRGIMPRLRPAARFEAAPSAQDAPGGPDDVVSALERLERLRKAGALTPEEYAAAKRRVLGGGRE